MFLAIKPLGRVLLVLPDSFLDVIDLPPPKDTRCFAPLCEFIEPVHVFRAHVIGYRNFKRKSPPRSRSQQNQPYSELIFPHLPPPVIFTDYRRTRLKNFTGNRLLPAPRVFRLSAKRSGPTELKYMRCYVNLDLA